jgi:hypothetical protein
MPIPWLQIANAIAKIGSIVVTGKDLSDQIRKLRRYQERSGQTDTATLERLQQLEKVIEMQAQLNEQYYKQMELLKSVLENFQRSLRTIWIVLLFSLVLSIAAALMAVLKT